MPPQTQAAITAMPDIAQSALEMPQGRLDWVGMSNIHQPMIVRQNGVDHQVQASVDLFVDLVDPHAKGIHMSRLYLQLDEFARSSHLSVAGVRMLLNTMFQSHRDISGSACVKLAFDLCIRRPALKSDNAGWNRYPVVIQGILEKGEVQLELAVDVLYSSTCPCSAALARQLIQASFDDAFAGERKVDFDTVRAWLGTEQGIVATPHSQRSRASAKVRLSPEAEAFPIEALVDAVEGALATPVQTAVKREDEQEFALRNGQNLMFCEDAARKVKRVLDNEARYLDFHVRIEHQESLHAHDAVAYATKGVEGGFRRLG